MKDHPTHDGRRRVRHADASCIALIDARYMGWLLGESQGSDTERFNRHGLAPLLSGLLAQAGIHAELKRVYWYSDARDGQYPSEQVVRHVASHGLDGGASLVRAMAADLQRLAERGACDHLLVASDDERLLHAVDEAQLYGLGVHLLADEAASNLEQLSKDDPGWARLLAQADRCIVLQAQAARDMARHRPGPAFAPAPEEDIEVVRPQLAEVITTWWEAEPEDLREDLREELQGMRGIPQELDRHLLLLMRKRLDRTLSFHEKKLMREMVRDAALGPETAAS